MPELSQDAIRELRQSLPLLERLLHQFNEYTDSVYPPPPDDIASLERASARVRALTSPEQFKIWVGGKIAYSTDEEDKDFMLEIDTGVNKETSDVIHSTGTGIAKHLHSYTHRLYLYVQEVLKSEDLDKTLTRLTQENTSLKEQLAELRKRELVYLSVIKGAQATTSYSVPPQEGYSLSASYQTERRILEGNLHYLRERAAMYGPLRTPLDIRNDIEAHEKLINEIDAHVALFEASKIDWT